jgi:CheY-like chemotaxis protein
VNKQLAGVPVLIVDDDAASAKLVSVALQADGCLTLITSNAEDALEALGHFKPRAIVLDLILPRMSGLLFTQQVKSAAATKDVVVIAISAINGPEAERIAKGAGCAAFLRKPIDAIALPELLLTHLGGPR